MPSRGLWEHSQAPLERFMGPRASQVELHGGPWFVDGTLSTESDSSKVVDQNQICMVFTWFSHCQFFGVSRIAFSMSFVCLLECATV